MEIEIISGFLGAGKTTFLNQYLPGLKGKIAVIENEFGDIGLDGELIREDVKVQEIYAGCICCSLALDFRQGIKKIAREYDPDRIIIEPSGVGRLSDIIKACQKAKEKDHVELVLTKLIVIVDLASFEDYAEDFGEFYFDQIRNGGLILFSNVNQVTDTDKNRTIATIQKENPNAVIFANDWRNLDEDSLQDLVHRTPSYIQNLDKMQACSTPAGKVFSSVSFINGKEWNQEELGTLAAELASGRYGQILRVKGLLPTKTGEIIHMNVTSSNSSYTKYDQYGEHKIIIIGYDLHEDALHELLM